MDDGRQPGEEKVTEWRVQTARAGTRVARTKLKLGTLPTSFHTSSVHNDLDCKKRLDSPGLVQRYKWRTNIGVVQVFPLSLLTRGTYT